MAREVTLDVRGMEPPQPLELVLETIGDFQRGRRPQAGHRLPPDAAVQDPRPQRVRLSDRARQGVGPRNHDLAQGLTEARIRGPIRSGDEDARTDAARQCIADQSCRAGRRRARRRRRARAVRRDARRRGRAARARADPRRVAAQARFACRDDGIHARAGRALGPAGGAPRGSAADPAAGLPRDAATGQSHGPGRPVVAALRNPRAGARTREGRGIESPGKGGRTKAYPIPISRRPMGRAGTVSQRPTSSGSSASNPRRVSPTRRRGSGTTRSLMPRWRCSRRVSGGFWHCRRRIRCRQSRIRSRC